MSFEEYGNDKDFVIHLHDIARTYESDFLRKVADRMDFMIEERRANGKYVKSTGRQDTSKAN